MKVFVVLSKGDCETIVEAVFTDRKKAEKYLIENCAKELDDNFVESKDRYCHYYNDELISICDSNWYQVDWWIAESEVIY